MSRRAGDSMKYLVLLLILTACGGGSYYQTQYGDHAYQPDVYKDTCQGYQAPVYGKYQQDEYQNRWKYIPPQHEQEPQPDFYINTQTGDSYMRFGDDENSWYIGPKGETIMPFGNWKIDQKGNTYLPFDGGYIDSKGTYFMPMEN